MAGDEVDDSVGDDPRLLVEDGVACVADVDHLDPVGPTRLQPVAVLGRSDPVVGPLHDQHRHRAAREPTIGGLGAYGRHLGTGRGDRPTGVDERRVDLVARRGERSASGIEPFRLAERLVEELRERGCGVGLGRHLAARTHEHQRRHEVGTARREVAGNPVAERVADDGRAGIEVFDESCDVPREIPHPEAVERAPAVACARGSIATGR